MEITRLKTFLYVVQLGSFQKAAKKLYLSQRAVSKQITQIETELGIQLVNRGSNRISMTPAGKTFYASAQDILNNYDHAVSELQKTTTTQQQLKVGYFSRFEQQLLRDALIPLVNKFPTLNLTIKEESNEHLIQGVLNDELDLALSIEYGSQTLISHDLAVSSIYTNTMVMGISRLNPLSHFEKLRLTDLNKLPILYYSPETSTYLQNSFLASISTPTQPTHIQRVASAEQMHLLVTLNQGFAFYPQGLVSPSDPDIHYVSLIDAHQRYDIVAIYKAQNRNPVLIELLEKMKLN